MCQIVYFVAAGDAYLSVLVTFSLAIPVVWVLQELQKKKTPPIWLSSRDSVGSLAKSAYCLFVPFVIH